MKQFCDICGYVMKLIKKTSAQKNGKGYKYSIKRYQCTNIACNHIFTYNGIDSYSSVNIKEHLENISEIERDRRNKEQQNFYDK